MVAVVTTALWDGSTEAKERQAPYAKGLARGPSGSRSTLPDNRRIDSPTGEPHTRGANRICGVAW